MDKTEEQMDPSSAQERRQRRPQESQGRDHLNLAEFPISVLPRQQPVDGDGRKADTIVYRSHTYDRQTRRLLPQTVTLTTASRYGLPTPADETLLLALLLLGKQADDFASNRVHFTAYKLFKLMRWAPNSRSYDRLRDVLRRLKSLTITYENAWWDAAGRAFEEEYAVGIIADYRLVRQVAGPRNHPVSWIRWDPEFYDSVRTKGTLKQLDYKRLLDLNFPTSQRMYRFLDKHFHHHAELDFDLRDFATGHIGLSPNYSTNKLKQKLRPALRELEAINYIEPLDESDRYAKVRPREWRIRFQKAIRLLEPRHPAPQEDTRHPLVDALMNHGVSHSVAVDLVRTYPADYVQQKIELLQFVTRSNGHETPENPGAWLVDAIKNDYQPPRRFKTKAQVAADRHRKAAEAIAKRQQQDEEARQAEADRLVTQQLFTTWLPIWEALPEDEQRALWERVHGGNTFFSFDDPKLRHNHVALEPCLKVLAQIQAPPAAP